MAHRMRSARRSSYAIPLLHLSRWALSSLDEVLQPHEEAFDTRVPFAADHESVHQFSKHHPAISNIAGSHKSDIRTTCSTRMAPSNGSTTQADIASENSSAKARPSESTLVASSWSASSLHRQIASACQERYLNSSVMSVAALGPSSFGTPF